jgi:hypothetical protein
MENNEEPEEEQLYTEHYQDLAKWLVLVISVIVLFTFCSWLL